MTMTDQHTGRLRSRAVVRLIEPALDEQDGEPLARVEKAISRGSELTVELRPLSYNTNSLVAIEARELARRVLERVRERADANDVDVVLHCTCGRVWVEPRSFEEALYELLDNAVQATRRGYPVIVDVRDTGEGDVLWQIQDAGEGMSEQVLAGLGRPSGAAGQGGRGVALASAVIEGHGGLLRFESAPGVGTTASVWLRGRC